MNDVQALRTAVPHADGKLRCPWPREDIPLYVAYHDTEWGVPEWDDRALFEKLILDGFQAGLSWITILRKREAFRAAFDGFDPQKIARYDARKVEALTQDAGIVRNRAKIESSIISAQAYLKIQERDGFSNYLWNFFDGAPLQNNIRHMGEMPAQTPLSAKISKDLKARGFNFCGPTIVYAFAQAVGMVNDHLVDCCRHAECAALSYKQPPYKKDKHGAA
jgi:DNA-3-methyladenine glycosylase I